MAVGGEGGGGGGEDGGIVAEEPLSKCGYLSRDCCTAPCDAAVGVAGEDGGGGGKELRDDVGECVRIGCGEKAEGGV